jgi:hypothetical protein
VRTKFAKRLSRSHTASDTPRRRLGPSAVPWRAEWGMPRAPLDLRAVRLRTEWGTSQARSRTEWGTLRAQWERRSGTFSRLLRPQLREDVHGQHEPARHPSPRQQLRHPFRHPLCHPFLPLIQPRWRTGLVRQSWESITRRWSLRRTASRTGTEPRTTPTGTPLPLLRPQQQLRWDYAVAVALCRRCFCVRE